MTNDQNANNPNSKRYDLEKRTTEFAKKVIRLCKKLPTTSINIRIIPQAISSSGSTGANYREANDALGKKDFAFRIRIVRKEAKESIHWLELLKEANIEITELQGEFDSLIKEAIEYRNIFSSILQKL